MIDGGQKVISLTGAGRDKPWPLPRRRAGRMTKRDPSNIDQLKKFFQ